MADTGLRVAVHAAQIPHESISTDDAEVFFSAIEAVLSKLGFHELTELYLFTSKKVDLVKESCFAISFDGDWQPFLGHTRGVNNSSKPPRLQITSPSHVLNVSRDWVKLGRPRDTERGRRRYAGRVFITRNRLFCDDQTLGTWQWDGEDPVERLRRCYDGVVEARREQELRIARNALSEAKRKEWDRDPAARELLVAAKRLFQRLEGEYLFKAFCDGFDWRQRFEIDEALRASIRECVLAKLKEKVDDPLADAFRFSAKQRLHRTGQGEMFEEISRRISTIRVRDESIESICDDFFKAIRAGQHGYEDASPTISRIVRRRR